MNTIFTSTLASIAKSAGVSKATVSRVLNNTGASSEETRERILRIAKDLNYVPNEEFRLLSRARGANGAEAARTGCIGWLMAANESIGRVADPYFERIFRAIQRSVAECGFRLVVLSAEEARGAYMARSAMNRLVDGLIATDPQDAEMLRQIRASVPVVLINTAAPDEGIPSVMPDDAGGVAKAVARLRALGHERITFFSIADATPPNVHHELRARAFRDAAAAAGMRGARCVVPRERRKPLEEALFDELRAWRSAGEMPSAILCAADSYAVAFIAAARRLGISVPGELSIVGTDDTAPCEHVTPKLSSIRQPLEAMGAGGVRLLADLIEGRAERGVGMRMLFDVEFVERESCARIAKIKIQAKTKAQTKTQNKRKTDEKV